MNKFNGSVKYHFLITFWKVTHKNYNINSSVHANNATFDSINLSSGQPIVVSDYLQTNYYSKLDIDSSFSSATTKITNLSDRLTNEYYMASEVLANFYT